MKSVMFAPRVIGAGPTTGKTTFEEAMWKRGFPVLDVDVIKECLAPEIWESKMRKTSRTATSKLLSEVLSRGVAVVAKLWLNFDKTYLLTNDFSKPILDAVSMGSSRNTLPVLFCRSNGQRIAELSVNRGTPIPKRLADSLVRKMRNNHESIADRFVILADHEFILSYLVDNEGRSFLDHPVVQPNWTRSHLIWGLREVLLSGKCVILEDLIRDCTNA